LQAASKPLQSLEADAVVFGGISVSRFSFSAKVALQVIRWAFAE